MIHCRLCTDLSRLDPSMVHCRMCTDLSRLDPHPSPAADSKEKDF